MSQNPNEYYKIPDFANSAEEVRSDMPSEASSEAVNQAVESPEDISNKIKSIYETMGSAATTTAKAERAEINRISCRLYFIANSLDEARKKKLEEEAV